jgi:hypothetical protein
MQEGFRSKEELRLYNFEVASVHTAQTQTKLMRSRLSMEPAFPTGCPPEKPQQELASLASQAVSL